MTGFPPSVRARLPDQQAGSAILWLMAAGAVLALQQIVLRELGTDGTSGVARRTIILATTAATVPIALHFRRFAGAWLVAAGIALNLMPMVAHGGLMPVAYETVQTAGVMPGLDERDLGRPVEGSKDIILEQGDIRVAWLADRHIITLPGYGANIYSAGDFVLFAGITLALGEALAVACAGGRQRLGARARGSAQRPVTVTNTGG